MQTRGLNAGLPCPLSTSRVLVSTRNVAPPTRLIRPNASSVNSSDNMVSEAEKFMQTVIAEDPLPALTPDTPPSDLMAQREEILNQVRPKLNKQAITATVK